MGVLDQRFEKNFMITSVDYVFNWARKSALWPLTFGLACCAIEMIASTTDRKSTRLNSSHGYISYAVFCLKKKNNRRHDAARAGQVAAGDQGQPRRPERVDGQLDAARGGRVALRPVPRRPRCHTPGRHGPA